MEEIVHLSMNYRILFLVFLLCLTAGPVLAASTGDYMGSGIQLGGSGTQITQVTTTAPSAASVTVLPAATAVPGSLSVTTTPSGATIFIDNVQRGISPATIPGLAPGSHALRLEMNGYTGVTVLITITTGQTQTYTTALSPVGGAAAPTTSRPASKKTPGFEPVLALFAMGVIMTLKKLS
jgi:hypothetical protein